MDGPWGQAQDTNRSKVAVVGVISPGRGVRVETPIHPKESSSSYNVTANCDLYAVAEFNLTAATPEQAKIKAQEILDLLTVGVVAMGEGRDVAIDLLPENIDLQMISVFASGK
jgi:hypothetical protein